MLTRKLLDTSRGRIVMLLQRGPLTVDDIAAKIDLTSNAIRVQITAMERDGVIRRVGLRAGTTRPSQVYELTPEVEHLLSRAYIPLLTHLVDVFAAGVSPRDDADTVLRKAGKSLAQELLVGKRPTGSLEARLKGASDLLNEQLGALTHLEKNGRYVIRGAGCPLSALTGKHPAVCGAMESLVTEVAGVPVRECCTRSGRPHCCFEVAARKG
jgi:DeoR family suf operon transcriptional repressor